MSETSSAKLQNCRCDYSYLRNRKGPKFEGESSTHAQFKAYQLPKQEVYDPPKPKTTHYDPQLLTTSYKAQYVKPVASNGTGDLSSVGSSALKSYMEKKAKVPFYSETEYKKSFEAKQMKVQKKPVYEYKPKNTKFEGSSSYKEQFQAKKNLDLVHAGQQVLANSNMYKRPVAKFEGQSSYKSTFTDHKVKLEKQPQYEYKPKNTRFEGESSYKAVIVAFISDVHPVTQNRVPEWPRTLPSASRENRAQMISQYKLMKQNGLTDG